MVAARTAGILSSVAIAPLGLEDAAGAEAEGAGAEDEPWLWAVALAGQPLVGTVALLVSVKSAH
jgi:hypothetical protein